MNNDIEAGEGLVFLLLIAAVAFVAYKAVAAGAHGVGAGAKAVGTFFNPNPTNVSAASPAGGSGSLGLSDMIWSWFHPNDPYSAAPGARTAALASTQAGSGMSSETGPPSWAATGAPIYTGIEQNFGITGSGDTSSSWDSTLTP